jgi:hypothetical protein
MEQRLTLDRKLTGQNDTLDLGVVSADNVGQMARQVYESMTPEARKRYLDKIASKPIGILHGLRADFNDEEIIINCLKGALEELVK